MMRPGGQGRSWLARALRYAWSSPNTALGAVFAILAVLTGGRLYLQAGVIEVSGGLLPFLLRAVVPIRGGARALTLGHVVLGRTEADLERTRAHERVHVRQYERWGPLFIPAYLSSSAWAAFRGRGAYRGNGFEREACELDPTSAGVIRPGAKAITSGSEADDRALDARGDAAAAGRRQSSQPPFDLLDPGRRLR